MPRIVTTPPECATASGGIRPGGWWHEVGRRPAAGLRSLSARLRSAAGRPGLLLRPREPRRADRLDHLRPQHRLLHRPDREEAAQPVLSRHGGALVRHARLQPGLQVLPELDDVAVARRRGRLRRGRAAGHRRRRRAATAAAAWPSPTTIRSSGRNTPSTRPGRAARWASRPWPSRRATSRPRPGRRSTKSMDAANVDLKGFTEEFYREYCGGHLQPVLDTLRWLVHESQTWVEITNLIIPRGERLARRDLTRMCQWIADGVGARRAAALLGVSSRFQADRSRPDAAGHACGRPTTSPARPGCVTSIRATSSIREHQHTYCPGCGRAVIRRDGYTDWQLRAAAGPLRPLPDADRRPVRRGRPARGAGGGCRCGCRRVTRKGDF